MTTLNLNCTNQVLTATSRPLIASGGVNEDRVEFTFCDMWNGFAKTAVFYCCEEEVYHVLLDDSEGCVIPKEVLASPGLLYIGVFGVKNDVTRTSSLLTYSVAEGAITEATAVPDPTPDVYSQIMSKFNEVLELGGIPGPMGPQGPQGKDGKTPEKGVDYYTEADKTEIVDAVLAALPDGDVGYY